MRIKDYHEFQHFKDRCPPWIKLYRNILEQRDIFLISDRSFRLLVGLWLLASEDETKQGILPCVEDISFRLRISERDIHKCIQELTNWVYCPVIGPISGRYQVDSPETETDREKETESFDRFWKAYPKKKSKDAALKAWKKKKCHTIADKVIDKVSLLCESKDWKKDGGQFIPHPATWLNRGGWDDEVGEQSYEPRLQEL